MHLLKSKVIILIILSLLFICGCSENQNLYDEEYIIDVKEIYLQQEEEYYVYFYKDKCPYCDDTFEIINEYLHLSEEYKNIKLYVCDLSDKEIFTYTIETEDGIEQFKICNNVVIEWTENILNIELNKNKCKIKFINNETFLYDLETHIEDEKGFVKKISKTGDVVIEQHIKRAYNGEGGQGPEGRYYVDGVTEYSDLYIAGVPSLIKIDKTRTSYYVTSGRKYIISYIEDLIKNTPIHFE